MFFFFWYIRGAQKTPDIKYKGFQTDLHHFVCLHSTPNPKNESLISAKILRWTVDNMQRTAKQTPFHDTDEAVSKALTVVILWISRKISEYRKELRNYYIILIHNLVHFYASIHLSMFNII